MRRHLLIPLLLMLFLCSMCIPCSAEKALPHNTCESYILALDNGQLVLPLTAKVEAEDGLSSFSTVINSLVCVDRNFNVVWETPVDNYEIGKATALTLSDDHHIVLCGRLPHKNALLVLSTDGQPLREIDLPQGLRSIHFVDNCVIYLTANGNTSQWTVINLDGQIVAQKDMVSSIYREPKGIKALDGDYYISYFERDGDSPATIRLSKANASMEILWTGDIGSADSCFFYDMAVDSKGIAVIVQESSSVDLIYFDLKGNIIWKNEISSFPVSSSFVILPVEGTGYKVWGLDEAPDGIDLYEVVFDYDGSEQSKRTWRIQNKANDWLTLIGMDGSTGFPIVVKTYGGNAEAQKNSLLEPNDFHAF